MATFFSRLTKRKRENPTFIVLVFTVAWATLALARLLTHEMWRDELQAWMIALDSHSPQELISNLRYEGHPGLWALCLFVITRFTDSPVAMQLLNLGIGTATVYVLIRFAPFPGWLRALLALGYYLVYEYGTISRSYGLGVLCIVLFCAIFTSERRRKFELMALILAALALTSVYGAIAAAALAAGAVVDAWRHQPSRSWRRGRVWGFVAIVTLGIVAAAVLVRQPPDAGFAVSPRLAISRDGALMTIGSVWSGMVPVPPIASSFWNQNILDGFLYTRAAGGLALVLLVFVTLRWHTTAMTIFAVGSIGLMLFTYLIYSGGTRHHGHYFLMFVASCWIAAATPSTAAATRASRSLLAGLAVIQLAVGTVASIMDMRLSFSGSRDATAYIRSHYPSDIPIVVDPELQGVSIAAWLGRDVFLAQSGRWGGFVVWNNQRHPPDLARALEAADRLSAQLARDLLVVVTHRMVPPPRFRHVGHFRGEIVPEETYDVYLLKYRKGQWNLMLRQAPRYSTGHPRPRISASLAMPRQPAVRLLRQVGVAQRFAASPPGHAFAVCT